MLKKLRLDATKTFEIALTANEISKMLVDYVNGRAHAMTIGCEQGDLLEWDDLIVEHSKGQLEHFQMKRNYTNFSAHEPDRKQSIISKGSNSQNMHDLSPLDDALAALADWTINFDPMTSNPPRSFKIALPEFGVLVKKRIAIRNMFEFSQEITTSTTAASMANLASKQSVIHDIYLYLTSWCGFQDWQHILRAFRRVKFVHTGTEQELDDDSKLLLSQCFVQQDRVLQDIKGFISANSTYTSAMTPRPLFGLLKAYKLSNLTVWSQYDNHGSKWDVGGIVDDTFKSVEIAEKVVPQFWSAGGMSLIKVNGSLPQKGVLQHAILRLIMHMPNQNYAHVNDVNGWNLVTKNLIGGTLGTGKEDCSFALVESSGSYVCSDTRCVDGPNAIDKEGDALTIQMNIENWKDIVVRIEKEIMGLGAGDIRTALWDRWTGWKSILEADHTVQVEYCRSMLHPNAEGSDIAAMLRLGPKTASLVANGIFLSLVLGIALSDIDQGFEIIGNNMTLNTRALTYWSGPSGMERKVRALADLGIGSLIGKESAKILILSGISNSVSEIKETTLAESQMANSLASPHSPTLMVTDSAKLKMLIEGGSLAELKAYFEKEIKDTEEEKNKLINHLGA